MRRAALVLAVAGLIVTACDSGATEAQPFQGIWQSRGWGMYLVVQGGEVQIFEHSAIHCFPVAAGGTQGIADVLSLDGERLVMHDSDREITFEPIEAIPEDCAEADGSADPERTVSLLVAALEEHYAGELGPGWDQSVEDASAASGSDLAASLLALVEPLPGVRVASPDGEIVPALPELDPPAATEPWAPGLVSGEIAPGVGYIGLGRVGPFASDTDDSEHLLTDALDDALRSGSVVVDLRSAAGGVPGHALLLATRFVPDDRLVARMEAKAGDAWVPAGDLDVAPSPLGRYEGQVLVLVGADTTGVGEITALALRGLPGVTLLGAPTAGSAGPPLIRVLPGGWSAAIPNIRVVDSAGDVVGPIDPDVESPDPLTTALELAG